MESVRQIEAKLRQLGVPEHVIARHCDQLHRGRSRRRRYRLSEPEKRHYVRSDPDHPNPAD